MGNITVAITIEQCEDGFVGTVSGIDGVVVGQGGTQALAIKDTLSATLFHLETFVKEYPETITIKLVKE